MVERPLNLLEPKPDWRIIQELSNHFGYPMDYESPRAIMEEIARLTPLMAASLIDFKAMGCDGPVRIPSTQEQILASGPLQQRQRTFTPISTNRCRDPG
jgi:predicted molibdopterin-dependent oxidoreductase YjgC